MSDLGDGFSWGEAKLLLEDAAGDTSTALGAELAGWGYTASLPELLALMAQIGDPKTARKVMPWVLNVNRSPDAATPDEVAIATAELDESIVFS